MHEGAPLAIGELESLFGRLRAFDGLIVAVSGGPDSMALLVSMERWASRLGRPPLLLAVTIDHGLRPESAAEARLVAEASAKLGIGHRILRWEGRKPERGIQAAAREARYGLLCRAARELGLRHVGIVTAHHTEDQAETVVMRLARGSGVDGLAGMGAEGAVAEVPLLRPLLSVAKARLRATVAAAGVATVEDASNADPAYERVRLRRAWPQLEAVGLTAPAIALAARRLGRAAQALETATGDLAAAIADVHDGAYATFDSAAFARAPEDLRVRLMARMLLAFGGQHCGPRLSEIEAMVSHIAEGLFTRATLGGCVVGRRGGDLVVYREAGRQGLPELLLQPGEEAVWDRRFAVRHGAGTALRVMPLGPHALSRLRRDGLDLGPMPALAARTLPSFWDGTDLVAVPHLGIHREKGEAAEATFLSRIKDAAAHATSCDGH